MSRSEQGALRIVLAEGDPDLRWLLTRRLARAGHEVRCLDREPVLCDALQGGEFDVALVDVGLLETKGRDLVRALVTHHRHVAVVLMSSFKTGLDDLLAPAYATTSLVKPFGWSDFENAIALALASRQEDAPRDRSCA